MKRLIEKMSLKVKILMVIKIVRVKKWVFVQKIQFAKKWALHETCFTQYTRI